MQLAQQALAHHRHRRPVDQRQAFQPAHLFGQAAAGDGPPHRCGAEQVFRRRVQLVEEQPAGRRIGAVGLPRGSEHGVQRADRQRVGAVPGGAAQQVLQRAEVAEAAVVLAAQRVDLRGEAPDALSAAAQLGHRRAARRRHRQRQLRIADAQLVVAALLLRRQAALVVEAAVNAAAVLQLQLERAVAEEAVVEVQRRAAVDGQQRRRRRLPVAHLGEAAGDLFRALRREAEGFQQGALHLRGNPLRLVVGAGPVEVYADRLGQRSEAGICHCGDSMLTAMLPDGRRPARYCPTSSPS
ncbi:hypothetical protein D3C76_1019190 [compost metagenome]